MKWSGTPAQQGRVQIKIDEGKLSKELAKKLRERKEKVDGKRAGES